MPLSTADRNAIADALATRYNGGSLEIATDGTFATILLTFALTNPFSGAASAGSISTTLSSANASASGNAEAFRFKTSGGTVGYSRTDAAAISETGGGGVIVLAQASTAIVSGQSVSGTFAMTMPAGT